MPSIAGQQLWQGRLAIGALTIILGTAELLWPSPSILVSSTVSGVYLLVSGFAALSSAFTSPGPAATPVLLLFAGALSIVLAILSFRHLGDAYAVLLLSLWMGTGFIVLGVSENAVAMSEHHVPGWGWYADLGSISMIAGGIMLVWPYAPIVAFSTVSGMSLVILGVIQLVQAFHLRRSSKAALKSFDPKPEQVAA